MKRDPDELTKRYRDEDAMWNLGVLKDWLVQKKSVPPEIADQSIGLALMEIDNGKQIGSHHGPHGFDNFVLALARKVEDEHNSLSTQTIKRELHEKIKMSVKDLQDDYNRVMDEIHAKMDTAMESVEEMKKRVECKLTILMYLERKYHEEMNELAEKLNNKHQTEKEVLVNEIANKGVEIKNLEDSLAQYRNGNRVKTALKMIAGKI